MDQDQSSNQGETTDKVEDKGKIDKLEKELILDALKSSRGNRAKAARHLGLTERKMGLRVDKFKIDTSQFTT